MKAPGLIILICLISIASFAEQPIPINKAIEEGIIAIGMNEEEITQILGEPSHKSIRENTSIWWYPQKKFICFKDGQVEDATFPLHLPEDESQDKPRTKGPGQ